jgi:DNA-binding MarR family transcriptional regulator
MSAETASGLLMHLVRNQSRVTKRLDQYLSAQGISLSEYQVLDALAAAPGQQLRRIDLAETVGLSASGVTRLLNPMEKIGLVRKELSPRDARVSLVALTEAGSRTLQDSQSRVAQCADLVFQSLDTQQRGQLAKLITHLR